MAEMLLPCLNASDFSWTCGGECPWVMRTQRRFSKMSAPRDANSTAKAAPLESPTAEFPVTRTQQRTATGEARINTVTNFVAFALLGLFVIIIATISWLIDTTQPKAADHRYVVDGRKVLLHRGDDSRWAARDWDDRKWTPIVWSSAPAHAGIYWLRFRIRAPAQNVSLPTGARITATWAYELYWDGTRLVRNGTPGNSREEEKPGRLDVLFTLPESLIGPGDHLVALRISSHRDGFPAGAPMYFKLDDPSVVHAWKASNALCPVAASGVMSFLTVVCGLFWLLAGRRPALLWLAALCLATTVMECLTVFRWLYDIGANWYYPVTLAGWLSAGLLAWCFVGFVATQFGMPRRSWLLLALAPLLFFAALLSPLNRGFEADWMLLTAFGAAIIPLVWAILKRRRGAWIVVAGILMSGSWFLAEKYWIDFFSQFFPALVSVIVDIALQIQLERSEARQARLTAARLEIDLLKKSMQPHFLMNTLTALAQTVEENPARAVKLIDDLADEFRRLSAMAGEKQVPLARELELCRAHLGVMRARTDMEWKLDAEGVDGTAPVPPALFLTLIENGFSHQRAHKGATTFTLRAAVRDHGVRYTFVSPGAVTPAAGRAAGGTGLRYVYARLEESFPGTWSLVQNAAPGGWETIIDLRLPATNQAAT